MCCGAKPASRLLWRPDRGAFARHGRGQPAAASAIHPTYQPFASSAASPHHYAVPSYALLLDCYDSGMQAVESIKGRHDSIAGACRLNHASAHALQACAQNKRRLLLTAACCTAATAWCLLEQRQTTPRRARLCWVRPPELAARPGKVRDPPSAPAPAACSSTAVFRDRCLCQKMKARRNRDTSWPAHIHAPTWQHQPLLAPLTCSHTGKSILAMPRGGRGSAQRSPLPRCQVLAKRWPSSSG